MGFPGSLAGKEFACSVRDPSLIPGSGRSPGEGISHPLQYSGLENSMDCIVHGIAKSQTQLSDFHFHMYIYIYIYKQNVHCVLPYHYVYILHLLFFIKHIFYRKYIFPTSFLICLCTCLLVSICYSFWSYTPSYGISSSWDMHIFKFSRNL